MNASMTWEEAVLWLRDQTDKIDLVRACYYDDPLVEAAKRFHKEAEWQALRTFLPDCGKVLDVGAGRGIASYALAIDGWEPTALEPDPSPIVGAEAIRSLAQDSGLKIKVVEGYAEDIPLPDNTFDAVVCRQALHHANDLYSLCREIARVLKPGGTLVAAREHVISRRSDLQAFLDGHPLHHLYGGESAYLLEEYLDALEGAGITVTRTLNPWESTMNLFPQTIHDIKRQVAGRFRIPFPALLPDSLIAWLGTRLDGPGRLYSFIGEKR